MLQTVPKNTLKSCDNFVIVLRLLCLSLIVHISPQVLAL